MLFPGLPAYLCNETSGIPSIFICVRSLRFLKDFIKLNYQKTFDMIFGYYKNKKIVSQDNFITNFYN